MPFWWAKLTSYPQFVELLAERWLGLRAGMLSLGAIEARVGAYNATVGSAEARNFAQFDLLKKFVYGGRLLLWTGGWNRWLESMGGIGGWNRWVGGPFWLESVGESTGESTGSGPSWLESVGGANHVFSRYTLFNFCRWPNAWPYLGTYSQQQHFMLRWIEEVWPGFLC